MTDKGKVLKGLECCSESIGKACPWECPYRVECMMQDDGLHMYSVIPAAKNNRTCRQNLMVDALDMIQKGEETITSLQETIYKLNTACGETRKAIPVAHYASPYTGIPIDHCPKCGKLIKRHQKIYTDEIRFCAYCGQEVIWNE